MASLVCGPTILRSREVCDGDHNWFPRPSHLGWDDPEVWYSGIDAAADDLGAAFARPVDLYNMIARCKRCGLSADSIISFTADDVPGICMECGTDLVPGETQQVRLGDMTYCPDCADRLRQREATCAECGRTRPEFTDIGELAFRFVTPDTYTQKHGDFDTDFDEGRTPICMDCWLDSTPDSDF